jgi:hypothetical protein
MRVVKTFYCCDVRPVWRNLPGTEQLAFERFGLSLLDTWIHSLGTVGGESVFPGSFDTSGSVRTSNLYLASLRIFPFSSLISHNGKRFTAVMCALFGRTYREQKSWHSNVSDLPYSIHGYT